MAFLLHTRALMSCMSCLTSALPEELTARTEKHRESGSLAKDNDKAGKCNVVEVNKCNVAG